MSKHHVILITLWNFIGASLQSLMIKGESITFKQKKLDLITTTVGEDENIAGQWIFLQCITHNAAQAIKAFAHVSLRSI